MINRAEIKKAAKEQIKGKIGVLLVISLIIVVIQYVASLVGIGTLLVAPAFYLSTSIIFLGITNGKAPVIMDTFEGFKDWWSSFKVYIFMTLFTFLWSLLFIIPGIIKGYSYAMSYFILAENPGMPALEAIDRSKKMMDGHKWDLFVLMLSFIGWIILACFTFGILYIWLVPYMSAAYANFYNEIKGETVVETTEPAPEVEAPAEEAASENN
ncbi:MAG: DUF975 family protein [Clostridia bacterium]|nr:DUF975 family protein [Clostridia bacterium]